MIGKDILKKYMKGNLRSLGSSFISSDKGKYVLSGLISPTLEQKVGRLVQVRQKQGAFGSDVVLIRESDGTLSSHHNQCFWIIPEQYSKELDSLFKNVYQDDADEYEYSIEGKEKQKGFLI
ncbi:hypothetical protein ACPDHD_11885 [Myroides odoratimimus]|uniref:hypothetical protein n=1 Tax=Myroides odoratimimus TaxID=76832 RepID=UPI003D2ED9C7